MEALRENAPSPPADDRGRDLGLLALLLLIVLGLRGWLLYHTEVPARDSIGFIRYALQFEGQCRPPQVSSWADVIRSNHQHPGYPLTILAVSVPVRLFLGTTAVAMQLSAQLASGLAAVLLVVPMFYLGKALFDRGIGFWGTLLFQVLPGSAHILSDGLSESLFLLLACTALVWAARALRTGSWQSFGLCGVFCGLTYLVRPEGGFLLVATGVVLVGMHLTRARRSWRSLGVCGGSLLLAAAVVGSPYVLITGRLSNKPSVDIMINNYPVDPIKANQRNRRENLPPPGFGPGSQAPWPGRPLFASIYGVWINPEGPLTHRLGQGLMALLEELVRGFHYVAWLPALVGVCWYAGRARHVPGIWVLVVLCGIYVLTLWRLAILAGYVSERHIQFLILAACYPAVGVLRDLPRWLAQFTPGRAARVGARLVSLVLLVSLIGVGLPKTVQKLHANRAGYHAAGLWLAQQVRHGVDVVQDRHCWAHFYAGEVFEEGKPRRELPGVAPICYLVVGRHKEVESSPASAEPEPAAHPPGHIVYSWPPQRAVDRADVVIYALPLRRSEAPPSTPPKPFLNFQFRELFQNAATR
jgi:4-amino-4-deoxy-L-arabinose transferase-like glycosyltransferase